MAEPILSSPILSLRHIQKNFGAITAIQDFSLDIYAGEIVALVGDNGAGKSTLVKIISGIYTPSAGDILLDNKQINFKDATVARAQGIEVVYQDLALCEKQKVYMNMFLGREATNRFGLLDKSSMNTQTSKLIKELDVRIPSADATIAELSGGQRQGIAIARAAHWARKMILLDEPTAALGVAETAKVETLIKKLKSTKLAILMISHSLDQVFRLSDRITVLRRGKQVASLETKKTNKNEIVAMITGVKG
ncbi:MAG: ATP-binding cassette domain-containing protein [Alphaproteobacteria bacterium]|nr:ATP-binding cassette domain-containing protein [Alphaproteobacteria bacterium]